MNRENALEALNTIYIRLMRLRFTYEIFIDIFCNPFVSNDFPNLCWCMKVSLATDLYSTINSFFNNGRYDFKSLTKNNNIKIKYDETIDKIEKIIPNIRETRNKMFCHLVEKQTNDAVCEITEKLWLIWELIKELHSYCCSVYNIELSELDVYDNNAFLALNKEFKEFKQLVENGSMSTFYKLLSEMLLCKSFDEPKSKIIKPEK